MENNILNQFGLPSYLKGKSMAEASKAIDKKFKGRNDKASLDTKNEFLTRLAQAQEFIKQQSQPAPQMNQNQMSAGGWGNSNPVGGGMLSTELADQFTATNPNGGEVVAEDTGGSGGSNFANYAQALSGAYSLGDYAFGDTGIKGGGQTYYGTPNTTSGTVGSLVKGASIGTSISPGWGTLIGAVVGGAAGLIGGSKRRKAARRANTAYDLTQNAQMNEKYELGGYMDNRDPFYIHSVSDRIGNIQIPDSPTTFGKLGNATISPFSFQPTRGKVNPVLSNEGGGLDRRLPSLQFTDPESLTMRKGIPENINTQTNAGKAVDWMKDNYGSILQTAPIAMNAYQLAKLKKPKEERLERLGNRYNPQYVDEASMVNKINNSYNLNAAKEGSAGNLGNYQANARATMLDRGRLLSDAYFRANQANLQENRKAQDFNLNVDRVNLSQSNLEKDINAKNKANYDTQKSKLLGQLGNDVGAFGKEANYKKVVKEMFGYSWDGKYWRDAQGNKVSEEDMKKATTILNNKKDE